MFNSGVMNVGSLFVPIITLVDQCLTTAVISINANGNNPDGLSTIIFEQETSTGSGIYTQTGTSPLIAATANYSVGSFSEVRYRIKLSRSGYTTGYNTYDNTINATISICNPPNNVSIVSNTLHFDDTNIIGNPTFHISDNLGGNSSGLVAHGSVGNIVGITPGATHASIYMTLRCFTSTTVSV